MKRLGLLFVLVLGLATNARAQDTVVVAQPGYSVRSPRELARDAVRMFNLAGTRLFGSTDILPGDAYKGDLAILDGSLRLEGEVEGTLIAINADVELVRGARVGGDVIIVGGTLSQDPDARIIGDVHVNGRHVSVYRDGERLELGDDPAPTTRRRNYRRWSQPNGRASITAGIDGRYNRVEGLPLRAGGRIRWSGSVNGSLEGVALGYTAFPFDSILDNLGYRARGHIGFGERGEFEIGGAAYDIVSPIEDWQLADIEVAFASAILRRDYRDYYGQQGVSAYAMVRPVPGLSLSGEVSRDEERSMAARDPWTLRRRGDAWRPNPAIDAGQFERFRARLEFDSDENRGWSQHGRWLAFTEWEVGRSDDVALQPLAAGLRGNVPAGQFRYGRILGDLRRYQPIGWSGELRLRAVVGTSLSPWPDSAAGLAPIQRRFALGGVGTMPGFRFNEFSCNDPVVGLSPTAMCRDITLLQAEYRGGFDFGLDFDNWFDSRRLGHESDQFRPHQGDTSFDSPQLVLFADAGRASGGDRANTALGTDGWKFDVGGGVEFGSLGFYVARATTSSAPLRFSLRLHYRF